MGELQVCGPCALSVLLSLSLSLFSAAEEEEVYVSARRASLRASPCTAVCARSSLKLISLLHEQLGCWSFSSSGFHVAKWLQRLPTNNWLTLWGVETTKAAGFPCRAPLGLKDTLSDPPLPDPGGLRNFKVFPPRRFIQRTNTGMKWKEWLAITFNRTMRQLSKTRCIFDS